MPKQAGRQDHYAGAPAAPKHGPGDLPRPVRLPAAMGARPKMMGERAIMVGGSLLAGLEAENAALRNSVVQLALEIQDLRERH